MTTGELTGTSALPRDSSVRTVIVGIDSGGRIMQYDRNAPNVLGRSPTELLGAHLSELAATHTVAGVPAPRSPHPTPRPGPQPDGEDDTLAGLLDAIRSDRELTGMLAVRTAGGHDADAVVTVHPMRTAGTDLAALAVLRIPVPVAERFVDPALMRRAMLDGTFTRIGDTLDVEQVARELIGILVPHFCNAGSVAIMESLIGDDDVPAQEPDGSCAMRRLAITRDGDDPAWGTVFPVGEILSYPPDSPYARCMATGDPVLEPVVDPEQVAMLAGAWRRPSVAHLLAETSLLVLPLVARGSTIGMFICIRTPGHRRFDAYDREIGMEFASRAAIFVDNARRYSREHATALTLQRSLLPTGLSAPSSVQVQHRYLPGSKLVEVGGDWYESIALPGARVALVVGDVAGHGVRAAVTMGQLRTAIHTLAMLELPPAESLQQLDELMHSLGKREPHFATCAYAVFDAVHGSCEVAVAGHLPPLLVRPDGHNEFVDVTPAPPLGVSERPIQSRQFTVADGSLLVLYTDGLVENRSRDIDDGLSRLRTVFGPGAPDRSLDELCTTALDGVYADEQRDDIAVLIARLRRISRDRHVTWTLGHDMTAAARARSLVRAPMTRWGLDELVPTTELLVSELVTNALRYSPGEVTLRLVLEGALFCEVGDSSAALPRLRHAGEDDETGRGLQVVGQLAARWGTRRTRAGKVVWCEQPLPAGKPSAEVLSLSQPKALAVTVASVGLSYSTVTLFARLRGLSMSRPSFAARW